MEQFRASQFGDSRVARVQASRAGFLIHDYIRNIRLPGVLGGGRQSNLSPVVSDGTTEPSTPRQGPRQSGELPRIIYRKRY